MSEKEEKPELYTSLLQLLRFEFYKQKLKQSSKEIEKIMQRVRNAVQKFASGRTFLVGDPYSLAEDACAFALLQLIREYRNFEPHPATIGDLKTEDGQKALFYWLRKVAINHVCSQIRKHAAINIANIDRELLEQVPVDPETEQETLFEYLSYILSPTSQKDYRMIDCIMDRVDGYTLEETARRNQLTFAQVRHMETKFYIKFWKHLTKGMNHTDIRNTMDRCKFTEDQKRAIELYQEKIDQKKSVSSSKIAETLQKEGYTITAEMIDTSVREFIDDLRARKG